MYLARNEAVHQLSADHTMAAELARRGAIKQDEVATNPYAHVLTRAIGSQPAVQVDTLVVDTAPGDRFLLCTDGFSEYVPDEASLAEWLFAEEVDVLPDELVRFADEAGGKDNITVVVIAVDADAPDVGHAIGLAGDPQVRLDAIASMFLFADLTLAKLSRVLDVATANTFEAGEVVVREDDPLDRLIIILEGQLTATRGEEVVGTLAAQEHFGATSLLRPRAARATVTASKRTRVLSLSYSPFHQLTRTRPWLGVDLLVRLGQHACGATAEVV